MMSGSGISVPQRVEQDGVVDRREVLADVCPQHVAIAARELLQPVDRAVGALAEPVGIAVRDEHPLEARLDDARTARGAPPGRETPPR